MKKLIICRHAKSSWKDLSLADWERPLNKRGKRDAPEMGARLARRGEKVDLIISSNAQRARRTAVRVAKELGYPKEKIRTEPLLYAADVEEMLEVIRRVDDRIRCLMMVGHNPECTELANALGGLDIVNVPTCGMVGIDIAIDEWDDISLGKGTLRFFDYPKSNAA